ncbi:MAG: hypothetical protein CGU28_03195 [Candidatus Dactylopiibacterium carminicum]|uniref:Uncharacterized protein n=1 Tax=Candidatus Dactylopiibacterium carminicum TaxID=857335 RepID=A0A272EYF4_9RHOO|nr:hypothetical protein [Candidatus Dactylopiibacterium carminicum]KAF7600611.1 hypothetical protein BGI27_01630 [Candidatus Dactylopiibacterium carminicum]PAS95152.1 MAG: hypothetical protein CGU29_01535 [Candidatus Dactylopiibacterium carminicum]PAS97957.1 MAG: hypothetical protein CGU28_03195 [Candidatus Dactylopiibacterium carminicum]PAT00611.1 MAG: hypothetical protein BSR46_01640 [Candidatus Dactylopiibacterium carminicum]
MHANVLSTRMRDAQNALGALLDHEVKVLSVQVGPTDAPPTIRIRPSAFTAALQPNARPDYTLLEARTHWCGAELVWSIPKPENEV